MSNDVIISVYHIHHLEFHDRTLHFSVDCKQKVKIWDKLVLIHLSNNCIVWIIKTWSEWSTALHQNDQTRKSFLPSCTPSYEHLTINVEHTLLLFILHTLFSFQICTYHTCTYTCLSVLCFLLLLLYFVYFEYLYIIIFIICVLLLSFCCTVELLSL